MKRSFDIITSLFSLIIMLPFYIIVKVFYSLSSHRRAEKDEYIGKNGDTLTIPRYEGRASVILSFWYVMTLVLRGAMSIVGPRLRSVEYVDAMSQICEDYVDILRVSPGIIAESSFYLPSDNTSRRSDIMENDLRYIRCRTFFLDLVIIFDAVIFFITNRLSWNTTAYTSE